MNATDWIPELPRLGACENCPKPEKTMYVHFNSGKVEVVPDVSEVCLTETQMILLRCNEPPAVYQRRDVYFMCCEPDIQPSPC